MEGEWLYTNADTNPGEMENFEVLDHAEHFDINAGVSDTASIAPSTSSWQIEFTGVPFNAFLNKNRALGISRSRIFVSELSLTHAIRFFIWNEEINESLSDGSANSGEYLFDSRRPHY